MCQHFPFLYNLCTRLDLSTLAWNEPFCLLTHPFLIYWTSFNRLIQFVLHNFCFLFPFVFFTHLNFSSSFISSLVRFIFFVPITLSNCLSPSFCFPNECMKRLLFFFFSVIEISLTVCYRFWYNKDYTIHLFPRLYDNCVLQEVKDWVDDSQSIEEKLCLFLQFLYRLQTVLHDIHYLC